jgi:hypothetical protein
MDLKEREISTTKILNRIKKSWFPLAAVAGALASFVSASFRTRPAPAGNTNPSKSPDNSAQPNLVALQMKPSHELTEAYVQTAVLGGHASSHPFQSSLADIAVGADDAIYALGDDEIRTYSPGGEYIRSWKVKPAVSRLVRTEAFMSEHLDGWKYIHRGENIPEDFWLRVEKYRLRLRISRSSTAGFSWRMLQPR